MAEETDTESLIALSPTAQIVQLGRSVLDLVTQCNDADKWPEASVEHPFSASRVTPGRVMAAGGVRFARGLASKGLGAPSGELFAPIGSCVLDHARQLNALRLTLLRVSSAMLVRT